MLYRYVVRPVLFLFPPERIHSITIRIFRLLPLLGFFWGKKINRLLKKRDYSIRVFGLDFPHPVGLAAGLDKNAKVTRFMKYSGIGFVEIGTITPKPQSGNPRPRLFRIKRDHALINRMGFNNPGIDGALRELRKRPSGLIIGGNIGKNTHTSNENAWKDYLECFKALYDYVDYFVVNISCPNIPDLTDLQDKDSLMQIMDVLMEYRSTQNIYRPVLLKLSPDLTETQLDEMIDVVRMKHIDGLVATNTSIKRDHLSTSKQRIKRIGKGGLSGQPLAERSTEVIRYLHQKLGDSVPIIASGGVMTPAIALEKLHAGALLVQVYTGYIYYGPGLVSGILRKMQRLNRESL